MKHRAKRSDVVGIEIAPLIDIVFILLIFFVVTSTFIRESELEIELPTTVSASASGFEDSIEINISASNDIRIGGAVVTEPTVEAVAAQLRAFTDVTTNRRVIVRADAAAQHQTVVRALDAANLLGLSQVNLITMHSDG
ncbi:MAG: biopolymer transporter ExbD [Gammaproteobacteria bacterium]|nr:biopolymer transporter ExbD [Gammaproteobacteria bacterium]